MDADEEDGFDWVVMGKTAKAACRIFDVLVRNPIRGSTAGGDDGAAGNIARREGEERLPQAAKAMDAAANNPTALKMRVVRGRHCDLYYGRWRRPRGRQERR